MTQKPNLNNPRLRHPCPKCGAEAGYPCHALSADGSYYSDTETLHAARPLDEGLQRRPGSQTFVQRLAGQTVLIGSNSTLDIAAPQHGVQVEIREDGTVLWVSVDGIGVLRICQMPHLEISDHRTVKGVRSSGKNTNRGR